MEKIVEFNAYFNQIGDLLNKEMANKGWIREISNANSRILKRRNRLVRNIPFN